MNHDNKHLCLVMFWNFFYTVCRSTFGLHIWFYLLKRLEIEWIKRQVNVWLHRAMLPASFIVVFRWEVFITTDILQIIYVYIYMGLSVIELLF